MLKTFFLAGFECATGFNARRQWIDQIAATHHDRCVEEDYDLVLGAGIRAVREAVRWPLVDRKGGFDFSSVRPMVRAANRRRIDVVWDLFHFGYPPGLDPFSAEFAERFAEYCYSAARFVAAESSAEQLWFTPVNEPSFFSWAAGEAGLFAPHCTGRGFELKAATIRAAIAGIDAIWAAAPGARIVNVDSLCRVVAPVDAGEDVRRAAADFNDRAVFQSWDMLAGRLLPELGGSPRHLDIVGMNYYWTNQWQIDQVGTPLDPDDPRCWSLGRLIRWTMDRTGAPVMVTETGHVGERRPGWMHETAAECEAVLLDDRPLLGVCLYPVLGMPEWHEPAVWTRMGLWDLQECGLAAPLRRVPHEPTLTALAAAQRLEQLHRDRRDLRPPAARHGAAAP